MTAVRRRLQRVLLGVEFSRAGEAAKEHAVSLCLRHGARLTLVHALEDPSAGEGVSRRLLRRYQDLACEHLNATRDRLAQRLATVDIRLGHGAPAHQVLVEVAAELEPDLIVLGNRGAGSIGHLLLGSTARRVVQLSERSVLAVPPARLRAAPIRSVLLPTDFSRDAELASTAALPLLPVRGLRPTVTLLHTVGPPFQAGLEAPQDWPGYHQRVREDTHANLEAASHSLRLPDCSIKVAAHEGDPGEVILEQARQLHVDLIAMGIRGQEAVPSPLLGSTSEKVLQGAESPVLLVNRDWAAVENAGIPPEYPSKPDPSETLIGSRAVR